MWKAEALRHKLGDRPIGVSSGFRDYACNSSVGGASNSRHLYGDALDLVPGPSPLRHGAHGAVHRLQRHLRARLPGPRRPHPRRQRPAAQLERAQLRHLTRVRGGAAPSGPRRRATVL